MLPGHRAMSPFTSKSSPGYLQVEDTAVAIYHCANERNKQMQFLPRIELLLLVACKYRSPLSSAPSICYSPCFVVAILVITIKIQQQNKKMMKTALALSASLASVAAFAPASTTSRSSSALQAKPFADALGVQPPLGLWDPLGIIADGDEAKFNLFRECEITHGRVAMLAVTGYLVTAAGVRFPGAEDIPDGLAAIPALLATENGKLVALQMFFFFAVATIVNRDAEWTDATPEFVGDYRNGALDFGWDKYDEKTKLRKRSIELNQGRAAMMGIVALVTHENLGVSILPGGYLPGHP